MSQQTKLPMRLRMRTPQGRLRVALLLIVPAAIFFNIYVNNIALSRDITGITFVQPVAWHYHSGTAVIPDTRRIHFSAAGLAEAMRQGHSVPLFVSTKYPSSKGADNPLIGVNVFAHEGDAQLLPEKLLEANLAQVQQSSGQALEVVEPITASPVATLPGARVVLKMRGDNAPDSLNRMTVYALVAGRLSFTIVTSDAAEGAEAVDRELAGFIGSLAVD